MAPKRSLGQNFLTSPHIAHEMAGMLPSDTAVVLEIGPGRGILTEALLAHNRRVVAIEKDADLLPMLSDHFADSLNEGTLRLIEGDALVFETLIPELCTSPYVVAANIPYNITGALLRALFSAKRQPEAMVLLVQREVAERIVAKNGKQSILSLSVAAYGVPRMVRMVRAGSFFPKPKVDSAVISIEHISRGAFENTSEEEYFFTLVKTGFAHKRKRLASNLGVWLPRETVDTLFESSGLPLTVRAEDVPLAVWLSFARHCTQAKVPLHH